MKINISILLTAILSLSLNGSKSLRLGVNLGFGWNSDYLTQDLILIDIIEACFLRARQLNQEHPELIDNDTRIEIVFANHHDKRQDLILSDTKLMGNTSSPILGMIGSGFSDLSVISSLISQSFNVSQCCGSSTSSALSNKVQYPNFFRTSSPDDQQAIGIANKIMNLARDRSISLLYSGTVSKNLDQATAQEEISNLVDSDTRVILWAGFPPAYYQLLKEAKNQGVYGPGYVWIGCDGINTLNTVYPDQLQEFVGTIFFISQSEQSIDFSNYWFNNFPFVDWEGKLNASSTPPSTNTYAYSMATCVDLMVFGFDRLLSSNPSFSVAQLLNGSLNHFITVPQTFNLTDLQTPSGKVVLDKNGDRIGNYSIMNFDKLANLQTVGQWSPQNGININQGLVYPGGLTTKPLDSPDKIKLAQYAPWVGIGMVSVVMFVVTEIVTVTFIGYMYHYRKKSLIRKTSFLVSVGMQVVIFFSAFEFLIMIGIPTKNICLLDLFVIPITFSWFFGLMFAKCYRIYRIFYNTLDPTPPWSDEKILVVGFLFTIPNILISSIWAFMDPPTPTVLRVNRSEYLWTCSSSSSIPVYAIILLIYNFLIIIMNLQMTLKTRNVDRNFNDTRGMALSIYNMIIFALFIVSILMSNSLGFKSLYLIKSITLFYLLLFNLVMNFGVKIYQVAIKDLMKHKASKTAMFIPQNERDSFESVNTISNRKEESRKDSNARPFKVFLKQNYWVWYEDIKKMYMVFENTYSLSFMPRLSEKNEDRMNQGACGVLWDFTLIKKFKYKHFEPNTIEIVVLGEKFEILFENESDYKVSVKRFEELQYLCINSIYGSKHRKSM